MKKRLLLCAVIAAALVCLCAFALAEDDPVKVAMELSAYKFTGPKTVTVTITVTSTGESDMPGPVALYYPNGNKISGFAPTLSVGSSKTWSGEWKVTQKQLEAGKVSFKYSFPTYDDQGNLQTRSKYITRKITYTAPEDEPVVEINRTINPTVAQKGQQVTITYDIVNAGGVDISDVTVRENRSISNKSQTVKSVKAGEKTSITFTVKMGTKNLTSEGTISYKAGGRTYKATREEQTIRYGQVSMTASLSADKKGGTKGDEAKLTLKIKNTGKTGISAIRVTDPVLGEVFSNETVEPNSTITLEKSLVLEETRDYQFTVTGSDPDGVEVQVTTDRVKLTVLDPAQKISLRVTASADRDTVYEIPGTVKFRITVTNDGNVDVGNIGVYAVDTRLYTFTSIPAGQSKEFIRDVAISMAGTFGFNARVQNQLGETSRFDSNAIYIAYAQPTPVPTEAPIVTPPRPSYEPIPVDDGIPESVTLIQRILGIARYILAGLAAIAAILAVIGLAARAKAHRESAAAMDHLDRSTYRDYNQPNPDAGKEQPAAPEEAPAAPAEEAASDEPAESVAETANEDGDGLPHGDIMEETLAKLYPKDAADPAEPELTIEDEPAQADSEGTSHRRRGHKA